MDRGENIQKGIGIAVIFMVTSLIYTNISISLLSNMYSFVIFSISVLFGAVFISNTLLKKSIRTIEDIFVITSTAFIILSVLFAAMFLFFDQSINIFFNPFFYSYKVAGILMVFILSFLPVSAFLYLLMLFFVGTVELNKNLILKAYITSHSRHRITHRKTTRKRK
jgi:hypothetical protein